MSISASELRANVYKLLDQVLETGKPLEIKRKGKQLRIVLETSDTNKLTRLNPHPDNALDNTEELPDLHWDEAWKPFT